MKLNIYNGKNIVKTYEVDTYDLLFGVVEDLSGAVKLDDMENGSDAEYVKMVANLALHSMGTVKKLLKDVFDGLTDEELRGARVSEMIQVLVDVAKYTVDQIGIHFKSKNV